MLLYSGHEEENAPHTQRVALVLSKLTQNALVVWESHGSRIIKASFKTKKEGITLSLPLPSGGRLDYEDLNIWGKTWNTMDSSRPVRRFGLRR
ncbi:unnamed protein product [Schistosoma curassoni]|uniref:Transmembrane protein n=1 Tax=Schistosoma curassoni TaxID=6186 RepID=A0A183K7W4_9TREM|nr:unnamed protein product [Schistosoma curassoni]